MPRRRRRVVAVVAGLAALGAALVASPGAGAQDSGAPACAPGGAPVVHTGSAAAADAKTYRVLPFDVQPGTTRVEVGYSWADNLAVPEVPVVGGLVETVLDLGLWDEDGVGTPEGFRGWSGSRQGRTADGQDPVWVQADTAERGYLPAPVEPGTWHVDLGFGYVAPLGATYTVTIRCLAPDDVGAPFVAQPVDPAHVADPDPGWYLGDLHLHAYHSHSRGPAGPEMVEHARAAGLDFVPVTEYVTTQHHDELGPVQSANPDLVIWPGREVITYYGHAIVLGETPHETDWRHGFGTVTLGDIQADSVSDGALFGIAHPTIFPTPLLASFCRGCSFTLEDQIDWSEVTTLEVVTGPVMVDDSDLGGPGLGVQIQNPFIVTALQLWQDLLRQGHKITAVSGSDDKLGPDYGASVTAVYAEQLSRPALQAAIEAGHVYVRTRGAHAGPTVEVTAATADGQRGIYGDTLYADAATITVHVQGGNGQALAITRDGLPAGIVPITSDDFTHTFGATRSAGSGPLGTFWRVDAFDLSSLSSIGNPVFLADPASRPPDQAAGSPSAVPPRPATDAPTLPATGGAPAGALAAVLAAAGLGVAALRRRAVARP